MSEREVLTWETFGKSARDLASQIAESGWLPDVIIAISRGGLIPAGALSYALGQKTVGAINVEFYLPDHTTLESPELLPPSIDLAADLGSRALVVDDVADSGRTLALVKDLLEQGHFTEGSDVSYEVRTAVIYHKPRSIIVPDYLSKTTTAWIDFPWSSQPPVVDSAPGE